MLKTIDEKVFSFNQDGYVIFKQAIPHDLIERFSQEFHYLLAQKKPININLAGDFIKRDKITSETELEEIMKCCRFIDVENFSPLSKELILFPQISQFLTNLYQGTKPTNIQTLTYKYSSQQGEHSDLYLVAPPWVGNYNRNTLTAAWIALEDADESNGALVIYPQSHLILNKKLLLNDFDNNYAKYVEYLKKICQENNIQAEYFYAKKGDVLFWHGDFIHAGGMIRDLTKTRFSLVCHYANLGDNHDFLLPKEHEHYRQRVYYKDLGYLYLSGNSQNMQENNMNNLGIEFSEAKKLVDGFQRWHQTFEIYPGIVTPGAYEPEFLMKKMELPDNLTEARVLDIGACDGYFSRELDKRGADVVALDYKSKEFSGFSIMEKLYGKSIKHINCNIYEIQNYVEGKYDIVLMLGVIYHLPDIIHALWLTRQYCDGIFILETHSEEHLDSDLPLMRYYKKDSLAGDWTNFWSPNLACTIDMLEDVGFCVEKTDKWNDRLLVHCSINRNEQGRDYKLSTAYGRLI